MRRPWPYMQEGLAMLTGLVLWAVVAHSSGLPDFILPPPEQVAARAWASLRDGSLLRHTWVTLQEVLAGLAVGVAVGAPLGFLLGKCPRLERFLAPYIIASQAVPMVAIAPLLVIWFGPGVLSKILITGLITFFPVLVNTMLGVHSVPEDLRDLFRSLGARPWQTARYLEIPATLPMFLGGLRMAATLSVIGAVVGEFLAAEAGLGFLINQARGRYDTALVFVGVAMLMALALSLYGLVRVVERRVLHWQRRNGQRVVAGSWRTKPALR
ncbi:MAG: ABC transporter permease [Chloroflexi bacterium]|nr:ABC transporter permease [Chloroflexota bacterium]